MTRLCAERGSGIRRGRVLLRTGSRVPRRGIGAQLLRMTGGRVLPRTGFRVPGRGQSRDRCRRQGEGAALRRRNRAEGSPSGRRTAMIPTSGQVVPLRMTGMGRMTVWGRSCGRRDGRERHMTACGSCRAGKRAQNGWSLRRQVGSETENLFRSSRLRKKCRQMPERL